MSGRDVVLLSLPGVQAFIAESRTTSDLVSASTMVSQLTARAAEVVGRSGGEVVIPSLDQVPTMTGGVERGADWSALKAADQSLPNRVLALAPEGRGAMVAAEAAAAVRDLWQSWVRAVFPTETCSPPSVSLTPGFPEVQWVSVAPDPGGYARQVEMAQSALAARRRVRSFDPVWSERERLCSVSGRVPAVAAPAQGSSRVTSRRHERQEVLGVAAWVKRVAPHREGRRPSAPSVLSVASAPFRAAVARAAEEPGPVRRALLDLHSVAEGLGRGETPVIGLPLPTGESPVERAIAWLSRDAGVWVHPARWTGAAVAEARSERAGREAGTAGAGVPAPGSEDEELARRGRDRVSRLVEALGWGPGTHFAVIVQDLDDMGRFLSGAAQDAAGRSPGVPSAQWHGEVSGRLRQLARDQVAGLVDDDGTPDGRSFAVPVYAGGDDLLVLAPAATALAVTERVRRQVPDTLRTASTAVHFAHYMSGLQPAIRAAVDLLKAAKSVPGKDSLGMGFERRSGTRHSTVTPWRSVRSGQGAGGLVTSFARAATATAPDSDEAGGSVAAGRSLSPRLVFDLQRDRVELGSLLSPDGGHLEMLRAELARLVARHSGRSRPVQADRELAQVLLAAGREEGRRAGAELRFDPVPAAQLAVFLRQEAR